MPGQGYGSAHDHGHVFTGSPLDRAGNERRDPVWLGGQLAHPGRRYLALRDLEALVEGDPAPTVAWLAPDELPDGAPEGEAVLLGLDGGEPRFAIDLTASTRRRWPGRSRTGGASPRCAASRRICPARHRDPRAGAIAGGLARAPSLLRRLRGRDLLAQRRLDARLRGLRRGALPARGPGRDRADHRRRSLPARQRARPARLELHLHRRLHGARRDGRGGRAPRGARGGGRGGRRRALPLLAALAVPRLADARLPRRGRQRVDRDRPGGDQGRSLVRPRRRGSSARLRRRRDRRRERPRLRRPRAVHDLAPADPRLDLGGRGA